jgi:hypothetical protein
MALTGANFKTAQAEVFHIIGRIEPKRTTGGWSEVERYPYTDADGNLLLEVVRCLKPDGTKTFIQVRPSGVEAAGTTDPERTGGVPTGESLLAWRRASIFSILKPGAHPAGPPGSGPMTMSITTAPSIAFVNAPGCHTGSRKF